MVAARDAMPSSSSVSYQNTGSHLTFTGLNHPGLYQKSCRWTNLSINPVDGRFNPVDRRLPKKECGLGADEQMVVAVRDAQPSSSSVSYQKKASGISTNAIIATEMNSAYLECRERGVVWLQSHLTQCID